MELFNGLVVGAVVLGNAGSLFPVPLADVVLKLSVLFLQPSHLLQVRGQAVVEVLHGDLLIVVEQQVAARAAAARKAAAKAPAHAQAADAQAAAVAPAGGPAVAAPADHGGGVAPAGHGGAAAAAATAGASASSSAPVRGAGCSLDAAAHGEGIRYAAPDAKLCTARYRKSKCSGPSLLVALYTCPVGVTCQAVQLPMGFASHGAHAKNDVLRGILSEVSKMHYYSVQICLS